MKRYFTIIIETKRTTTTSLDNSLVSSKTTILEQVQKCRKLSLSLEIQQYTLNKIFDHYCYFNAKKIAKDYLEDTNIIEPGEKLTDEDRKLLIHYTFKMSRFLGILRLLGFIERYNSKQFRKTELMSYI